MFDYLEQRVLVWKVISSFVETRDGFVCTRRTTIVFRAWRWSDRCARDSTLSQQSIYCCVDEQCCLHMECRNGSFVRLVLQIFESFLLTFVFVFKIIIMYSYICKTKKHRVLLGQTPNSDENELFWRVLWMPNPTSSRIAVFVRTTSTLIWMVLLSTIPMYFF